MLVLGIETSCDETAVALIRRDDGRIEVLDQKIASQVAEHRPYGGVVPEIATRQHLLHLPVMIREIVAGLPGGMAGLDGIGVTRGPGLASSLLVGLTYAKGLALAAGKPWIGVNHMEGHLFSPFLAVGTMPVYPHLALIVSGGHTLLIHASAPGRYARVGGTLDDAAGECFDKVAKLLGLEYPGGPWIEKLALAGNSRAVAFPRSMMEQGNYDFSFSGLKTAVRIYLEKHPEALSDDQVKADVCASFQVAVTEVLVEKCRRAARAKGLSHVTLSGGVSCNSFIASAFKKMAQEEGFQNHVAPPRLSTDNAVMIAGVASERVGEGESPDWRQDADPNLRFTF